MGYPVLWYIQKNDLGYYFAKFNRVIDVPEYTNEEYDKYLTGISNVMQPSTAWLTISYRSGLEQGRNRLSIQLMSTI